MKQKHWVLLGAAVLILGLSGCDWMGVGENSTASIAEIAAIVSEYQVQSYYSGGAPEDDSLIEDAGTFETAAFSEIAAKNMGAEDLTIDRELNDNGTPDDPTDEEQKAFISSNVASIFQIELNHSSLESISLNLNFA